MQPRSGLSREIIVSAEQFRHFVYVLQHIGNEIIELGRVSSERQPSYTSRDSSGKSNAVNHLGLGRRMICPRLLGSLGVRWRAGQLVVGQRDTLVWLALSVKQRLSDHPSTVQPALPLV